MGVAVVIEQLVLALKVEPTIKQMTLLSYIGAV